MILPLPDACREPERAAVIRLIAESFERLLGRPLVAGNGDVVEALWHAPAAVVAHGMGDDPVFFFGNQAALDAFECDFAQFTHMPSRLSAAPADQAERQSLLDRVTRGGFIDDYAGERITATGRRFRIGPAVVWNLIDDAGMRRGQAATFAI